MKKIGIICEFNPFHNGHRYLIDKIKEKYPESMIILILSGNFTQRGDVSVIDKWKKTEIALMSDIDLVVELPIRFSIDSADYFAYGAVTLLEKLKVDTLIFGSESDDISTIEKIVDCQLNNKEFDNLVKLYSKTGVNYPTAMSNALMDLTGEVITTPNDLLGISYIKTIKENNYNIKYETIKRTDDYHASGNAIREALKENKDVSNYVPNYVIPYLNDLHFIDQYFNLLKYKIITENDLSIYHTVDEDIVSSLKKELLNYDNIDDYIKSIKSKRYTYNKIQRMLLHILLNIREEDISNCNDISYIRLLGFNDKGKKHLNSIKKDIDIPIISKINRDKDKLLELEIECSKIYALNLDNDKQKELLKREFKQELYK